MTWPPPYKLRTSKRAKHVNLKISVQDGLELIIPVGYAERKLPDVLASKRSWIEKHLKQINQIQSLSLTENPPTIINLHALTETWKVDYITAVEKPQLISRPNYEISVFGNIHNKNICHQLLRRWLKAKAKSHLIPWLFQISETTDLRFNQITIRSQKTRWGSCSKEKNINLNGKLLFLPPELVEHVMIHELCHTAHLNHSKRFWKLVSRFDPNWKAHNAALNRPHELVPTWME